MNDHESKRRGGEECGLPDSARDPLMPLLFEGGSTPPRCERRCRKKRGMLVFFAFALMLSVCALSFAYFSGGNVLVLPEDSDAQTVTTDEWRGAFASREIYESAVASAVSIRVGKRDTAKYCSGVVLDAGGVIATAIGDEAMLDSPMYVMPNGGGEYAVTSVELDRECGVALLKIPADSLVEATLSDTSPHIGESVISVSASPSGDAKMSLRSCDISAVNDESNGALCFELDRADIPAGSPIFDESGGLLAIVGKSTANEQICAVSAASCKSCFKMLGAEDANNNEAGSAN